MLVVQYASGRYYENTIRQFKNNSKSYFTLKKKDDYIKKKAP